MRCRIPIVVLVLTAIALLLTGCSPSLHGVAPGGNGGTSVRLASMSFVDPLHGWIVASECTPADPLATSRACRTGVYRSDDGGGTWAEGSRFLLSPSQVAFADQQTGWLVGSIGDRCGAEPCPNVIMATADGGKKWDRLASASAQLLGVSIVSAADAWALGQVCRSGPACAAVLVKTDSAGQLWDNQELPLRGSGLRLLRLSASTAWLGASVGGQVVFLRSQDGGESWQTVKSPCFASAFAYHFLTPREGWLACVGPAGAGASDVVVYHTADLGQSWNQLSRVGAADVSTPVEASETPGSVASLVFTSPAIGLLGLPRGVLLRTSDGGRTWKEVLRSDEAVQGLQFVDAAHGWALGNRHVWATKDGGLTWIKAVVGSPSSG